MFTKILYPTDFSEVSGKTLECVKKLREAGATQVIVAHVIDERDVANLTKAAILVGMEPAKAEKEQFEDPAMEDMEKIRSDLQAAGLEAKVILRKGRPFKEILRLEEEEEVDITVIGSHGKSNLKEMMLGSVSEAVIRKSLKPVLVCKRIAI